MTEIRILLLVYIFISFLISLGNGPSGLALSYILSGRWPYYNGQPHPDPMLTLRLQSLSRSHSLLEQDLAFLSQVNITSFFNT